MYTILQVLEEFCCPHEERLDMYSRSPYYSVYVYTLQHSTVTWAMISRLRDMLGADANETPR